MQEFRTVLSKSGDQGCQLKFRQENYRFNVQETEYV